MPTVSYLRRGILATCCPYLDSSTHHYLAGTPWTDDNNRLLKGSLIHLLSNLIESVMNPTCAANVASLLCHSAFREWKQFKHKVNGSPIWLPSLFCRSECKQHWETWLTDLDSIAFGAHTLALPLLLPSPWVASIVSGAHTSVSPIWHFRLPT